MKHAHARIYNKCIMDVIISRCIYVVSILTYVTNRSKNRENHHLLSR